MKSKYFTDFIQAHVEKSDPQRVSLDKLAIRDIVLSAGLSMPKQYFKVSSINEVDFESLPDPVVLKLTNLSSKAGIYLLYKIRGGYFEQLSKRLMTTEDILEEIGRLTKGRPSPVLAEEVVVGENGSLKIPFDYKVYTFNGKPEFVFQVDRNNKIDEIAFFDGEFSIIDDERVSTTRRGPVKGTPLRPSNYLEVLETASAAAKHLDRPFISVDMYTTGSKVFVGELTPTPGAPYFGGIFRFSNDFDLYLGGLMASGYEEKGWEIPEIKSCPPCRKSSEFFMINSKSLKKGSANLGVTVHEFSDDGFSLVQKKTSLKDELELAVFLNRSDILAPYLPRVFGVSLRGKSSSIFMEYLVDADKKVDVSKTGVASEVVRSCIGMHHLGSSFKKKGGDGKRLLDQHYRKFDEQLGRVDDEEINSRCKELFLAVESVLLSKEMVFCHNDINNENLVYDEVAKRIRFIDFGMADFNFSGADFHHLLRYSILGNVDEEVVLGMMREYSKEVGVDFFYVYVSCCFYCMKRCAFLLDLWKRREDWERFKIERCLFLELLKKLESSFS